MALLQEARRTLEAAPQPLGSSTGCWLAADQTQACLSSKGVAYHQGSQVYHSTQPDSCLLQLEPALVTQKTFLEEAQCRRQKCLAGIRWQHMDLKTVQKAGSCCSAAVVADSLMAHSWTVLLVVGS